MIAGQYHTVIVANGAFPTGDTALEILRNAKEIVCCDGAVHKLTTAGFEPTALVGDLDSVNAEELQCWQHCTHQDKATEYNDLQKALKYCLAKHLDHIAMIGCNGLRDDHFIANLSIMATYSDQLDLMMITDHGRFLAIRQTTNIPSFPGEQVSVFCKNEHLPLTFHRLKYPVKKRCFKHFWEGSLNEALSNEFTIELHSEGVVVVYLGNK